MSRKCVFGGLVLGAILTLGCSPPTSLLLHIENSPGLSPPPKVQILVLTPKGVGYARKQYSVDAASGMALGSFVIYPPQGETILRLHVRGSNNGVIVSEGVVDVVLQSNNQLIGKAILVPGRLPDADGDEIPDNIDNCPTVRNPGQESRDGIPKGPGDACSKGGPAIPVAIPDGGIRG